MIVIVDYGIGNLRSIQSKFEMLKIEVEITSDAEAISRAEKLVFPGIGHFEAGMATLEKSALIPVLEEMVIRNRTPLLAICLGMQMLTRGSEESSRPGLGWIGGETERFHLPAAPGERPLRVPHMGWNNIAVKQPSPLVQNLSVDARFYFAHSYYVTVDSPELITASTWYGHEFVSMICQDNIWATQFHPEKSHQAGLQIIRNFADLSAL